MNEADFLANIAKRLGRQSPLTVAPKRDAIGAPEFWQQYKLSKAEQIERFQLELEKLGGSADVYSSVHALQDGLKSILQQLSPRRIGTWSDPSLKDFQLQEALQGYDVVTWEANSPNDPASREALISSFIQADIGITSVDFAIADTGSIVLFCNPEKGRSVSLLPSVHIALLRTSQIITRMGEMLAEVSKLNKGPLKMPSSINIITGPSRSSDIENDLTIGVHGPVALFVLIWDDSGI